MAHREKLQTLTKLIPDIKLQKAGVERLTSVGNRLLCTGTYHPLESDPTYVAAAVSPDARQAFTLAVSASPVGKGEK